MAARHPKPGSNSQIERNGFAGVSAPPSPKPTVPTTAASPFALISPEDHAKPSVTNTGNTLWNWMSKIANVPNTGLSNFAKLAIFLQTLYLLNFSDELMDSPRWVVRKEDVESRIKTAVVSRLTLLTGSSKGSHLVLAGLQTDYYNRAIINVVSFPEADHIAYDAAATGEKKKQNTANYAQALVAIQLAIADWKRSARALFREVIKPSKDVSDVTGVLSNGVSLKISTITDTALHVTIMWRMYDNVTDKKRELQIKKWGVEVVDDIRKGSINKIHLGPVFKFIGDLEDFNCTEIDFQAIKDLLIAVLARTTSADVKLRREELMANDSVFKNVMLDLDEDMRKLREADSLVAEHYPSRHQHAFKAHIVPEENFGIELEQQEGESPTTANEKRKLRQEARACKAQADNEEWEDFEEEPTWEVVTSRSVNAEKKAHAKRARLVREEQALDQISSAKKRGDADLKDTLLLSLRQTMMEDVDKKISCLMAGSQAPLFNKKTNALIDPPPSPSRGRDPIADLARRSSSSSLHRIDSMDHTTFFYTDPKDPKRVKEEKCVRC